MAVGSRVYELDEFATGVSSKVFLIVSAEARRLKLVALKTKKFEIKARGISKKARKQQQCRNWTPSLLRRVVPSPHLNLPE